MPQKDGSEAWWEAWSQKHHGKKKEARRAGGTSLCRRCPEGLNTERGLEGAGETGRRVRRQGMLPTKHTHGHTDIPGSASCVLNPVGRNSQVPPQSPRRLITESLIKNTITEPMLHRERRHSDAERQGGRHTAGERQQQAMNAGSRAPGRRAETPVLQP